MKKNLLIIVVVLLAVFFYFESRGPVEKHILRIGMECDYVPNNWEEKKPSDSNLPIANKEGAYAEGYDLQIAKIVAEKIGAKPEIFIFEWGKLLDALNNNEIDAVFSGMLDTEERRKIVDFSDTYEIHKTEYSIVVRKGGAFSNAKKLSDFSGARILGTKGTLLDEVIDQIPGVIHLPPVNVTSDMFDCLNDNQTDGFVLNLDSANSYVKTYENCQVIKFDKDEGFALNFNGICAAVKKDNTKLLSEINNALKSISQRERQRIMDRTMANIWKNF